MAHFALLWKARTIEKCRQNYENEKYISIEDTNIPIPQRSLSQRLRCYRQDTQKRFSKVFQKIYPEGSSLVNFFLYLRTDQTCLHLVLKSLLGFLIGLGLTYLCFLFLVFQLSISLFYATIVSSIIGVLLTMGLAFSYRIRCLIFLLLPQFFSRAGRYTLTCYALVLILTGPATNTLKNSEVLTESMACREEQIKSLLNEVKDTARRPLNSLKDSIKIMVQKVRLFARELKQMILKVNRLTLNVLETIQSTFSWLQWLSGVCNQVMGSPFDRCLKVLQQGAFDYKQRFEQKKSQIRRLANKIEEVCSNVKHYRAICVFTDFVNGSFVASIRRRLMDYGERIRNLLYLQIHVHHSYSFSSNTSHSASQVAAGIVTEIRKRADPLLTWLSWSSCVTSLFLLLIIFRAKYYQHMFETRSRFDNKYITKELRDLDLNMLRHGRETILPLNKRERSKYVSTTSFRLVASEKIHLNRSIVFMAITTFKLLIHMVADYSLYWVLMNIRHHGKNQTPLPFGVPNAGMHMTGTGRVADMFRSLLSALTTPLEKPQSSPTNCLPDPHPPDLKRYTQIGILIFLLWFFALFEPYGLRLRHVIMGLYRPKQAKARAEWLYNHILRTRGGFMKFARRKLHRSYKYCSEEKYTFKRWLNEHIPFCWLRCLLGIPREEAHCLLCGAKQDPTDPNTKLQKCNTQGCLGVYCCSCFSDIGELCTICLSPSDYGDLSDVSLEKGSSDESDDDSGESHGGAVVPKTDDEITEQDIFDDDSDDIFLPKPLRDIKKFSNTTGNNEHEKYSKTRLKKQNFNLTYGLSNTTTAVFNIDFKKKIKEWRGKVMKNEIITITISSNWNIFKNTMMSIRVIEIKRIKNNDIYVPEDITKGEHNETSGKEKHVKGRQDEQKSKQTQNRPVPKDIGERKDDREKSNNGLDEKSHKNKGMQRGASGDDCMAQDDTSNTEQEFPYRSLKQFNAVCYSYWLSMKNNLFNGCNFVAQAVINNTLEIDEKNNYKTRKKVSLEIPESSEFRLDIKDSREYRIFTFLAEQEWFKKTSRYESAEKEIYLINERADTKTVEHLKKDLFSHSVQYVQQGINKERVLVCEDCKYNCLCPRNPLNFFNDSNHFEPVEQKDYKEVNCIKRRSISLNKKKSPLKCMSVNNRPKPKKVGLLEKIKSCFKCLWTKKCRKTRKVCGKTPVPCKPTKMHTDSHITEMKCPVVSKFKRQRLTKITCVPLPPVECERKSQGPNRAVECEFKEQKLNLAESCDPLCPVDCECKGRGLKAKTCDPLCPVDCECKGHEVKAKTCEPLCPVDCECKGHELKAKTCDPLCPVDCKCKGHGVKAKTCDPLCPVDCECKGHGVKAKTCDPLCPVECECKGHGLKPDTCDPLCPVECECKGHGLKPDTCDPLCPIECKCKGEGVMLTKCDPLCPYDCTCKGHGIKIKKKDDEYINKKCIENKSKKYADEQKKRCVDRDCQCSENSSASICDKLFLVEGTKKAENKFCSCAIQCILLEYDSKECSISSTTYSSCSDSIVGDECHRSDFTETDNTCYACYDYCERSRRQRRRVVFDTPKNNQCTATDTPTKSNIGTITNERGLVKRYRYYLPQNIDGDIRVVDHKGVCAKKIVAFKSHVHLIPSEINGSNSDIYTPMRYLLESQRYYNELFAFLPYVYPISAFQDIIQRPFQRSRSGYRKGDQAKLLENASYGKRIKIIPMKQVIDHSAEQWRSCRKKTLSSFRN